MTFGGVLIIIFIVLLVGFAIFESIQIFLIIKEKIKNRKNSKLDKTIDVDSSDE